MPSNATRDDFSPALKRVMGERVAYMCSNPICQRLTIGPHSSPEQSLRVGRAAHICAAASGGPRYDPTQTPAERASLRNGIWLCSLCADVIDKDVARFPKELLLEWKLQAEQVVLRRVEGGLRPLDSERGVSSGRDKVEAERLLMQALDLIAGRTATRRLTWRDRDPAVLEQVRRLIAEADLLDPASPRLSVLRAIYFLSRDFPDRALTELSTVNAEAQTLEHRLLRAECLCFSGEKEAARKVLEDLVAETDVPASAHYNLGYVYLEAGDDQHADEQFRKALQIDREYVEAWDMLGSIAYHRGDLVEAAGCASAAYSINPKDSSAARNYATVLLDGGRVEDALVVIRDSYQLHPTDWEVTGVLGRALAQAGEMTEAEVMLRRSINLQPRNPIALKNLATLFIHEGRMREALDALERAVRVGHPDAEELRRAMETLKQHLSNQVSDPDA